MTVDVSIVVPIHNSMPHLERCLSSIGAQTRAGYEVICVDDGSTDGSPELVERFSSGRGNVRLIRHKRNQGVSAARNTGLDHAEGRYVLFVDGDDFLEPRLIEVVLGKAEELGGQMTVFGYDEYYKGRNCIVPLPVFDDPALVKKAFTLDDLKIPSTELLTPNVWRILYEHSFLEGVGARFHEDLKAAEDLAFIYETLPYARRICAVPERLYHYRRDGGATLTRGDRGLSGLTALEYISERLTSQEPVPSAERHFTNVVLDTADYAMWSASSCDEYCRLFERFATRWLPFVREREGLVAPRYLPFFRDMREQTAMEHLFALYASRREAFEGEHAAVSQRDAELREARAEEERLRSSWAFRIGRIATFVPSKAKSMLLSLRG